MGSASVCPSDKGGKSKKGNESKRPIKAHQAQRKDQAIPAAFCDATVERRTDPPGNPPRFAQTEGDTSTSDVHQPFCSVCFFGLLVDAENKTQD